MLSRGNRAWNLFSSDLPEWSICWMSRGDSNKMIPVVFRSIVRYHLIRGNRFMIDRKNLSLRRRPPATNFVSIYLFTVIVEKQSSFLHPSSLRSQDTGQTQYITFFGFQWKHVGFFIEGTFSFLTKCGFWSQHWKNHLTFSGSPWYHYWTKRRQFVKITLFIGVNL